MFVHDADIENNLESGSSVLSEENSLIFSNFAVSERI